MSTTMLPQPATSSFASAILQCAPRLRALRVGLAEPSGLQRGCRAPAQILEAARAERALPFAWHRVARSGDDSVGQRIARPVAVPVVPGPSASAAGRREQIEDEIWVAGVNRKIAATVEV